MSDEVISAIISGVFTLLSIWLTQTLASSKKDASGSGGLAGPGPFVFVQWLLLCILGWAISAGLMPLLLAVLGFLNGILAWAIFGVIAGALQSTVLSRYVENAGWWTLVSALGWGTIALVPNPVVAWPLAGAVAGLLQFLVVLRPIKGAPMWVVASALGGLVGGGVSMAAVGLVPGVFSFLVAGAVGGAVFGLLTALFVVPLLRRSVA